MDHGTSTAHFFATQFPTSVFRLTVRLIPVITQIGHLIAADDACLSYGR